MAIKWNALFRVIRSYSIEEKVISLVLALLVIGAAVSGVVEFFKNPGLFVDQGGTYTEGISSDKPVILNPLYVDFAEANREVSSLIFSGLTKYDPDLKAFVGDMADLTVNEEGTVYSFKIKDGIKWHDGEDFTADDVYFTYHDVIQHEDFQNPVIKANFDGVEINKTESGTVEFVLKKPNSFFITNLNVGILPKHLLENTAVADLPNDAFNLSPVGTGPYMVSQPVETGEEGVQRIFLGLNEKYYGIKPKIRNIRFHVYLGSDLLAKEKGTVNVIAKVPKEIMESIEEGDRFWFVNYELPQYTAVFFNMNNEVLKKEKVRIAMQKAVDKSELLKLLPNRTAVDTPLMELDQAEWLYKPNLEEANGALFDAGYKWNQEEGDQFRKNTDGENLKFVMLVKQLQEGTSAAEDMGKVVDFLITSWNKAGVEIEVQYVPSGEFEERVQKRDYDMLLTGESLGYNLDTYSYWHSSQADGNGLNLSNYKSFVADSLIEKIRKTFDLEEKEKLLKSLAEEISQDVPAIFMYRPSYVFATDNKVKNIKMENLAYPSDRFAGIADWCIECE